MPRTIQQLTDRQSAVLAAIVAYVRLWKQAPTVRELMDELGYASPNAVRRHLTALAEKGFIDRYEGTSRGILLHGKCPLCGK